MRTVVIGILLALAVMASAADTTKEAEGDIKKYHASFPPSLVVEEIFQDEIDVKTFILVEKALLVPDRIRLVEAQVTYHIEVVDEDELDRFEPVARFQFPEVLELKALRRPGLELVRYEQRMWRKGLRVAFREYETAGGAKVRYTAFRVAFEPCGGLYRATLTIYQSKRTLAQQLDATAKYLERIRDEISGVQSAVHRAEKTISGAFDVLKKTTATLEKEVKELDRKLAKIIDHLRSIEGRVKSLEETQKKRTN